MAFSSNEELPASVKSALPSAAQSAWRNAYNGAESPSAKASTAQEKASVAWAAVKSAGYKQEGGKWVKKATRLKMIAKVEDIQKEAGRVFGWAYVSVDKSGSEVIDASGDQASIEEVEIAFYELNKMEKRTGGEMHLVEGGDMIECMVFTKEKWEAIGVDPAGMPQGAWVGYEFDKSSEAWAGIASGKYKDFSIEGSAIVEAVEEVA